MRGRDRLPRRVGCDVRRHTMAARRDRPHRLDHRPENGGQTGGPSGTAAAARHRSRTGTGPQRTGTRRRDYRRMGNHPPRPTATPPMGTRLPRRPRMGQRPTDPRRFPTAAGTEPGPCNDSLGRPIPWPGPQPEPAPQPPNMATAKDERTLPAASPPPARNGPPVADDGPPMADDGPEPEPATGPEPAHNAATGPGRKRRGPGPRRPRRRPDDGWFQAAADYYERGGR